MNKIEKLFEEFIQNPGYPIANKEGYDVAIRLIREVLPSCANKISWDFIRQEIIKHENRKAATQIIILWTLFAVELDKNGLLNGQLKGLFAKNSEAVCDYATASFNNKQEVLKSADFNPMSLFLLPRNTPLTGREKYRLIVIPNLTAEASDFIKIYLSAMDDTLMQSRWRRGLHLIYPLMFDNDCLYLHLDQYNDETFMEHFNLICKNVPVDKMYAKQTMIDSCLGELVNFYNWIQTELDEETRKKNFKKFTLPVLKYQYLASCIKNGFDIVHYSIYDNPPTSDKWIINPQNMCLHQTAEADKLTSLDLSGIQNIHLKKWVKECYWFDDAHNIHNRTKEYRSIFEFIEPIDKKYKKNEMPSIGVDDILSYKAACVAKNTQDSTVARKLGFVKYFLNFINDKHYFAVDQLLFRLLIHHDSESNAYKETYTKEEIKSLLAAYKDSYEKCDDPDRQHLYALFYYVIAIQSISEMRTSTILNLKTDCLVKTLERNKNSEYKVVVQSKTSGRDFDEYNITRYVKGLIDEVKALTSDLREVTTGIEKDYLFIYRRHNHKVTGIARQDNLGTYHKRVCKEYGIRELQLGAIRNYYQQQVSEYVSENGDDPMLIERLSKHGINVHIQHYDTVDIKDFCQRFYQVEIGSVELKGRVEEINDKPKQNDVAHGCGHCTLSECVLRGNLECLMCDKFVTTLDCIPFFEKEIESIDEMIINQPLQHEKEFLNNKKRLNVAYLTKLYELEAEINGNSSI